MESAHVDLRPSASGRFARLTISGVTYLLDRNELLRLAEMVVHTNYALEQMA